MVRYLAPLLSSATFALCHLAALLILSLISAAIGRRLTARVTFHNALESLCFTLPLGLGVISFIILTLGTLRILHMPVLLIVLAACVLACHGVIRTWIILKGIKLWTGRRLISVSIVAATVVFLITPFFVFALYPSDDWDAGQYHLAVAKIYVREHATVFTPYLRYPVFPQTNQMLFTGALLVYDDPFAQQIQLLMLLTLATTLIAFCVRYFTSRAGWWSASLLLASPLIIYLGTIAYADVGLMLFVFLAYYALRNFRETQSDAWLIISGAFCGLAFGAKYTGAVFPVFFCLILLWTERKRRPLVSALIVGGVSVIVAGPWLVRSIYYAGNPLFPFFEDFFTGIFGPRFVDPEGFREQVEASLSVGTGRSLLSLLKLPWNVIAHQEVFKPEAPVSPLIALLLPLTLFASALNPRIRTVLALAVCYTVFWFFGYQFVRYLVPALPFFCVATAASADWFLLRLTYRWPNQTVRGILTGLICLAIIAPAWYYAAQRVHWEGFIPSNTAERDAYLAVSLPSYPAYRFLNTTAPENYRVYALDDVKMAYYADGVFMGDSYGEARYDLVRSKMGSGEALYDELKRLRADYLVFNAAVERVRLPRDDFFRRNFKPVFSIYRTEVFELTRDKAYQ